MFLDILGLPKSITVTTRNTSRSVFYCSVHLFIVDYWQYYLSVFGVLSSRSVTNYILCKSIRGFTSWHSKKTIFSANLCKFSCSHASSLTFAKRVRGGSQLDYTSLLRGRLYKPKHYTRMHYWKHVVIFIPNKSFPSIEDTTKATCWSKCLSSYIKSF